MVNRSSREVSATLELPLKRTFVGEMHSGSSDPDWGVRNVRPGRAVRCHVYRLLHHRVHVRWLSKRLRQPALWQA